MTSISIDIKDEDKFKNSPPHKGKRINMMEISNNGKCLVTYSEEDKSVVGWDVDLDDMICSPKSEIKVNPEIYHMRVSNGNILAYIYKENGDGSLSK